MTVDQDVLNWVIEHRSPMLTDVFTVITTVGNTVSMAILTVLVATVLWLKGRRPAAVSSVAAVFAAWVAMNAIKYSVRRERPPMPERIVDASTYSFPSGHAMVSAAFVTMVFLIVVVPTGRRALTLASAVVLGAVTVAIGLSRIYLAAHWLTDVVAGWLLGVLCAAAVLTVMTRWFTGRPAQNSGDRADKAQ